MNDPLQSSDFGAEDDQITTAFDADVNIASWLSHRDIVTAIESRIEVRRSFGGKQQKASGYRAKQAKHTRLTRP
ncbi:protein of unknown function [Methylocaldum szegediense]|uniref:Transposase n=1 Tax=Methylocaldum szegediense TaxID=73780 RepID=A0ABM9HVU7_9GAMM|nr:protein of unknown function [Methylocaldum szegediense]